MHEKGRVELHCRSTSDLATLRPLARALESSGQAVVLTAAAGSAEPAGLPPGPVACAVRVLVAGTGSKAVADAAATAARTVVLWDRVGGGALPPPELSCADVACVAGSSDLTAVRPAARGRVVACGLPRLDPLREDPSGERARARASLGLRDDVSVILYAPSAEPGTSAALGLGEGIRALARTELVVAILPGDWPRDWIEAHRRIAASVAGFVLLDDAPATQALAACDLVLSDGGGLVFEAASLGRAVVLFDAPRTALSVPETPTRSEAQAGIEAIGERARSAGELERAVRRALRAVPDPSVAEAYVASGSASDRVCEAVRAEVASLASAARMAAAPAAAARVEAVAAAGAVAKLDGVQGVPSEQALFDAVEAKLAFGDTASARATLEAHVRAHPSPRGFRLLASIRRQDDDLEGAEDALERAEVGAQREWARIWCERARLRLDRGENEEAVRAFERARELAPALPDAWVGLGSLALHRDDPREAESLFRSALELEKSARAWSGLGLSLAGQGRPRDALAPLETALESDSECLAAVYGIVKAGFDCGELERAERHVARFVELHPGNLDLVFTLAGLRQQLGDVVGARDMAERIELFDPHYPGLADLRDKLRAG